MPRMRIEVERLSVPGVIFRLGVYWSSPLSWFTPVSAKKSLVNADTDMATSCSFSTRRLAVTITSSNTSAVVSWAQVDGAIAVAGAARARAIGAV